MTEITYLDFELQIDVADGNGDYLVTILQASAGEAQARLTLPGDAFTLAADLVSLPATDAQSFGLALFDALLTGEIRSRYAVSQQMAAQQERGLRLKLRITPSELLAVPWELLYDPNEGEFVCLTRQTPLVRYLAVPQPIQRLIIQPPLRILGMIASPSDYPALDVAEEQARLRQALAPLQKQGLVELAWVEGQSWRSLQQALQRGPWHVFHYIGHATYDTGQQTGVLLLVDEEGATHSLSATELARLLGDQPTLGLAVLNACQGAQGDEHTHFSSLAGRLVQRGLPAVIAMQAPITDVAALEFAQSFYSAISNLLPVDAALSEARKAISLAIPTSAEWATPVLYLRAPDGMLWGSTKQAKEKTVADQKKTTTYHINTGGGDVIQGNVNTGGGDFVGRNKVTHGDDVPGYKAGGDVIVSTVGAGSKNVATGKNIMQTVNEGQGMITAVDQQAIAAQLTKISAQLAKATIDPKTAGKAEVYLETLQEELSKTDPKDEPDGDAIAKAGEWLLNNVPDLVQAVTELFGLPAVGRVLGKAGDSVIQWCKKRFG